MSLTWKLLQKSGRVLHYLFNILRHSRTVIESFCPFYKFVILVAAIHLAFPPCKTCKILNCCNPSKDAQRLVSRHLRRLLKGEKRLTLEHQIRVAPVCNLAHEPLERQLPEQQVLVCHSSFEPGSLLFPASRPTLLLALIGRNSPSCCRSCTHRISFERLQDVPVCMHCHYRQTMELRSRLNQLPSSRYYMLNCCKIKSNMICISTDRKLQASLPVVDNNWKVVGALSVVGEKFSRNLAKNCNLFRDF